MIQSKSIVLSGASGQLGQTFKDYFEAHGYSRVVYLDKNDLNINDIGDISKVIEKNKPEIWINCSAYTAVDLAEEEYEKAFEINAEALLSLSEICKAKDMLLVHFSTDYVFDGGSKKPYTEQDEPDPINVYGMSKLEGEENIIENASKYLIFRTSWLFSNYGKNFVKSMLNIGSEKKELQIVDDQIASPTYAKDLVEIVSQSLEKFYSNPNVLASGIYHITNSGQCSWKGFAEEIFRLKNINCTVKAISTEEYNASSQRPLYSKLDTKKIENELNISIRSWQEALKECLTNM